MDHPLILNVADHAAPRDVRTRALENAGFRVIEASSGGEALALIDAEHPELVVLDMSIPDMSSLEVCRQIKARNEPTAIPVLHVAGNEDCSSYADEVQRCADACLTEPVDSEVFLATARALLRMRQAEEALEREVAHRQRGNRALRLLSETTRALLAGDSPPEELLAGIYPRFATELGLEVYLHYRTVPGDDGSLELRAHGGISADAVNVLQSLKLGQSACGTAAKERRSIIAEDIQCSSDPMADLVRVAGLTALMCNPLVAHGRLLGTLSFGTRQRPRLEAEEVELLRSVSDHVALAIERNRLHHEVLVRGSLLDHVHNAVIATDVDGRIVYWNPAAEAMYQWKASEVIGRNIGEVTVPPGDEEQAARIMAVVGLSGHWEGEFRVRRKDGSTFPGFVSDAVIRSRDGSIAGYVGVTADLSAQKEAEESLRRSEQNYRRIVETAAEGIWIIDTEGHTTFANARMASMLGYTVEEMQTIGVFDVVFPEDEPVARKSLARRQEGISEIFDFRLRRRDGGEIWARVSARPLHDTDGRLTGSLRMLTDITERRRAQQVIEEGERKLRRLVEANIIGVITADRERILEANTVFLEMVGYTREDLAAGRIRWPEMTPPEYAEISRRAEAELLSRGTCRTFEKEYIRKDGSRIPVLIGATILNEKFERLCFVLDLTERKRAEAALREVRHMESLGFLAGGVAHNLNNLLVAMMGSASLLLETSALSLEDRELADGILASSERAANLTRQLLAYAGKGGFLARSVELSELISGLADVFRSSIPKTIDLRLDLDGNLPPIHADESQMSQLVTELIMNASEAIDGGPGEIELTTRVETITEPFGEPLELGELSPGRHIVIRVTDTGSGMDERTLARAFDPFFSTKFAGRGLGLAALAGIVRSHRGGVRITSAPGKGSSFTVYLPAPE